MAWQVYVQTHQNTPPNSNHFKTAGRHTLQPAMQATSDSPTHLLKYLQLLNPLTWHGTCIT